MVILSQLPQPILHHILSLLPQKDAVQTSVLSKSWRYLWHGRLNVEFRDNCFARKNESWSFLDNTLQRYLDQNLSLQKFLVDIDHFDVDLVLLQKWVPMAIMNMGVKSLTLIFRCNTRGKNFSLPLVVFQSESLVELNLQWHNLYTLRSTDYVMLNNLRTLRLFGVYITDEVFEKILSGCPLIENLDLFMCTGMKSIKLPKLCNIKNFSCTSLYEIIIEIENPQTLESVRIRNNYRDWFLHHRNTHFTHLKSLKLYTVRLPEKFDNFLSFFPCINELILDSCFVLKEFRISSSSIKRLTVKMDLINPEKRIKVFIDTPNILYFEYSGHVFLPSFKFMATSNEWKSHISVSYELKPSDNEATSWFLELNKLLKALSQSRITLNLNPKEYEKLHINDSLGGFYNPVVVEQLKLPGCFSFSSDPTILNCLFRICRPRYIHTDQFVNELVEFICNLIPEKVGCYFWLQDLEELRIEVWDMKAGKWNCVQRTSLPALPSKQPIRFRLTWREQLSKLT
ncbi:hypothetical protein CASFOL_025748 [Castilleja foliolosa]|uniref:F-box domain-containing protein n=1 Tax=Castilleja foliolosa TaxID=1961234 RepID=A0ABD3CUI9_9LAMI